MFLFRMSVRTLLICALALLVAVMFQGTAQAAQPKQKSFGTPEAAVEALVKALRDGSEKELLAIFGPGSEPLISLCIYPGGAGHNYGDIETEGFPRRICRIDGKTIIR